MAIRDTLLANVTTQLASTSCGVSSELPWNSGQLPLYEKNMKKFYLAEENQDISTMFNTLQGTHSCEVYQTESTLTGYLSVDAKNQPTDIASVVSSVLNSRLSVSNVFIRECVVSTEIDTDKHLYTFEYRFVKVNDN
jgi:hypothetical protein